MALIVEKKRDFPEYWVFKLNFYINIQLNLVWLKIVIYCPQTWKNHDIYPQSSS